MRHTISKEDLGGFIALLFKIIRSKFLGRRSLIFRMVPSALPRYTSPIEVADYELREVSSWDMIDQAIRKTFEAYKQYIWWDTQSMLAEGSSFWLGYLDGQLANIIFTTSGDKVRAYYFPMTSECVLISHCVTLPQYRGLHLYSAGLAKIIHTLAGRGFKRFYIGCPDWNTASVQGICRAGFVLLGRGIAKRNGRIVWYQELRPDVAEIYREDCGH